MDQIAMRRMDLDHIEADGIGPPGDIGEESRLRTHSQ